MSVMSQTGRWLYNGVDVSSNTYVYGTVASVPCKADEILVQYNVATLTATTLYFRVEGKFPTMNRWAEVYASSMTATTNVDRFINISERFSDLRVGTRIDINSTPNIFYCGVCTTEYK